MPALEVSNLKLKYLNDVTWVFFDLRFPGSIHYIAVFTDWVAFPVIVNIGLHIKHKWMEWQWLSGCSLCRQASQIKLEIITSFNRGRCRRIWAHWLGKRKLSDMTVSEWHMMLLQNHCSKLISVAAFIYTIITQLSTSAVGNHELIEL